MRRDSTPRRDSDADGSEAAALAEARREAADYYVLSTKPRPYTRDDDERWLARCAIVGLILRGVCSVVFVLDPKSDRPIRVLPRAALSDWHLTCCGEPAGSAGLIWAVAGELACAPCAFLNGVPPRRKDKEQPGVEFCLSAAIKMGGLDLRPAPRPPRPGRGDLGGREDAPPAP